MSCVEEWKKHSAKAGNLGVVRFGNFGALAHCESMAGPGSIVVSTADGPSDGPSRSDPLDGLWHGVLANRERFAAFDLAHHAPQERDVALSALLLRRYSFLHFYHV
jgi:hypothetical protein